MGRTCRERAGEWCAPRGERGGAGGGRRTGLPPADKARERPGNKRREQDAVRESPAEQGGHRKRNRLERGTERYRGRNRERVTETEKKV